MMQRTLLHQAVLLFLFLGIMGAAVPTSLSTDDEIRAGQSLLVLFRNSTGFAETQESKGIEAYLTLVGKKLAQNASRKLPYNFHLDLHPGFRSAVAYPGGTILVGGGVLALMQHEDELAIVLGHEIAHVDLNQCAERVVESMKRNHLGPQELDKLSIEDFGAPYGKEGELAADREGLKLAVEAGYSPHAAIELLELYQFLSRDRSPSPPRPDAPSLEERIRQAKQEIKSEGWTESKPEKPLTLALN